jgi:hypothetical protein
MLNCYQGWVEPYSLGYQMRVNRLLAGFPLIKVHNRHLRK